MIKIAINGFGRIGRQAYKIALEKGDIEIAAINDLTPIGVLCDLLKYDSVYGKYNKKIQIEIDGKLIDIDGYKSQKDYFVDYSASKQYIVVDGKKTLVISQKDPSMLPWKDLGVDVVLECTGRFTSQPDSEMHLKAGAKKVIISAPTKDDVPTYLLGVNADEYKNETIISNASCTTNCIGPVAKVMHDKFKIQKAVMTTIHSVTAEQNLTDNVPPPLHADLRRARSALANFVPTTTGAAIATTKAIPDLKEIFDGVAVRVPTICGSLTDFTFLIGQKVTKEEVNQAFIDASQTEKFKGILETTYDPLVSTDIIGTTASSIVDLSLTQVVDGDLVKVLAWYDNEWGYSNRLVEIIQIVSKS